MAQHNRFSKFTDEAGTDIGTSPVAVLTPSMLLNARSWSVQNLTGRTIYVHSMPEVDDPPSLVEMQAGKCTAAIFPGDYFESCTMESYIYMATGANATIYVVVNY